MFNQLNLEIASELFKVAIRVYTVQGKDLLLTCTCFNRNHDKKILLLRRHLNQTHFDVLFDEDHMNNLAFAQNLVLSVGRG